MSQAPGQPAAPARRRPLLWIAIALAVIAASFVTVGLMLLWSGGQTLWALGTTASAVTSGDPTTAAASIEDARGHTQSMRAVVDSAPVAALRAIPYLRTNLEGVDALLAATDRLYDAGQQANTAYARLMGADGQGPAAFDSGTVNVRALQDVEPQMTRMAAAMDAAGEDLAAAPDDLTPPMRWLVERAGSLTGTAGEALSMYERVLPELPALLGEDRPATYLVVFHNPGELYAGGGAALSAALLQLDKGRMEIIDKGAVSRHFFPGNPRVAWNPRADGPYYPERGARDGFAWSNLHQDYRVAGEDLMRSWAANGQPPVDGVISLDPAALQAAVAATGPIDSELYGRITADNLVQKLLYEGYNEDPAAQERRHQVNQELVDEMLSRMDSGPAAVRIGRALLATAPEQHIRVRLAGNRLAGVLNEAHLDGSQPDAQPDRVAFYTQNQNASKVDIFQTRKVVHDVELAADGSARVTQTASVTNNAPENGSPVEDRIGYTTRWAFHWNIVWLPEGAQDVSIDTNDGEVRVDDRVFTDVDGRKAVRVGRWIPPGDTSLITATYRLPDGTFGADGNLKYVASVEHQLLVDGVDLTINVTGPSAPTSWEGYWEVQGNRATTGGLVTRPTTVEVSFGS